MKKYEKILLIENYLQGTLNVEQVEMVDQMISADEGFAEEVAQLRVVLNAIQDRDLVAFHQKITDAWDVATSDQNNSPEVTLPQKKIEGILRSPASKGAILCAIIFILAASAFLIFRRFQNHSFPIAPGPYRKDTTEHSSPTPTMPDIAEGDKASNNTLTTSRFNQIPDELAARYVALAEQYYLPPDYSGNLKTTEPSTPPSAMQQAQRDFEKGEYQKVINELTGPAANNKEARLLCGHAYFRLKNYAAASDNFSQLTKSGNPFYHEAQWFLLLSRLAEKGASDSLFNAILSIITENKMHPYNKEAVKLKEYLNNM